LLISFEILDLVVRIVTQRSLVHVCRYMSFRRSTVKLVVFMLFAGCVWLIHTLLEEVRLCIVCSVPFCCTQPHFL